MKHYKITFNKSNKLSGRIPDNELVKVRISHEDSPDIYNTLLAKKRKNIITWYIRDTEKNHIAIPGPSFIESIHTSRVCEHKQLTFAESTVNFLSGLCVDFLDLKEIIDADMEMTPTDVLVRKKVGNKRKGERRDAYFNTTVELWQPQVDENSRYRVIKGHMQSRKTWAIITMSLYYLLKYRISTFIVVQNSLDACEQMMTRIKEVFGRLMEHMDEADLKEQFDKLFKVLDCTRGKTSSRIELTQAMNGRHPRIYVVLRSKTDIKPVNEIVKAMNTRRYITMIDESDFNDSGTKAGVQDDLVELKENSSLVYDITATPMTSIMKETIESGNVHVLSTPNGYKGILHIQCVDLTEPATYCVGINDDPFTLDPNLENYIRDFSKTEPHLCRTHEDSWGLQRHPRYSLVRFGTAVEPQLKVSRWCMKKFGDKILSITYNGGGHGLTIRGNMLPKSPIDLGEKIVSKYSKGVHTFVKGVHIGKVIAYLQEYGGVKKYPRIMVFAGKMADRGISFGTSEYGKCMSENRYPWHLTEMYLIASKSMTQSNLLQAVGRLCGVYPDNIPLTLFTNSGRDVYKSFGVQEELIERSKKTSKERLMKEIIPEQAISKEKCSKRKITAPKVSCKLMKVENDFLYGGLDWDTEGYSYDGTELKLGSGRRENRAKVIMSEEEKNELRKDVEVRRVEEKKEADEWTIDKKEYDRIVKMFPRWADGDSKIANFMNNLNPRKGYTKPEILEETRSAGIRLTDCIMFPGQKRVKYGNILQNVGSLYRLQPCLVKSFEKYFDYH